MRTFTILLVTLGAAWPLYAQRYPIHMTRRVEPGQTYDFSATGSTRRIISSGERALQAIDFQVNFEGRAKVEEVDRNGEAYKVAFTVARFTRTRGDATVELVKPGSVIIADGSREERLSLEDGVLDKAWQEAFAVIYSVHRPNSDSDDEIFGTKQARSVGDSWPIDASRAAHSAQKNTGLSIQADQLSGTARFVAVDKVGGAECARIEIQMKADDFSWKDPRGRLPVNRASLKVGFGGCFPLRDSAQSRKSGADLYIHFQGAPKDGPPVEGTIQTKSDGVWLASGEVR